jgi:predicted Zn finger-like uncharacterized protein
MAASQSQTVVIVCPHCGTRYQVPSETIGSKGRQVQCAHCSKAWQAMAEQPARVPRLEPLAPAADETEDDRLFDADAEAELDAQFEAEQRRTAEAEVEDGPADVLMQEAQRALDEARAVLAAKPAAAGPAPAKTGPVDKTREKAFSRRQAALRRRLPLARVRRTLRIVGVGTLALMLTGGLVLRADLVRLFPDLAGAYEAVGLGVNVVGLDFRDVTTLISREQENEVIEVDARIYSVSPGEVKVPPVVVTLLDAQDRALYQWSVAPSATSMRPGEILDFSTQVRRPPPGATKARLGFAQGGRAAAGTPVEAVASGTSGPAESPQQEQDTHVPASPAHAEGEHH